MIVAPQASRTVRCIVRTHRPNMCFGERRKSGEPKAGDYASEGRTTTLRGMMWADNHWLFSDNREELICMVNDTIGKLLNLDMEPKPESLWWTSTYKHEDMRTLRVGSRQSLGSPLMRSLRCTGIPFSPRLEVVFRVPSAVYARP